MGITLTMLVMFLLIAKQYKNYYLTPALLLAIPGLFISLNIYKRRFKFLIKKIIIIPGILLSIFCLYHYQLKLLITYNGNRLENKKHYMDSYGIDKKFSDKPVLMICNYTGSSFRQYSLLYGMVYTGGTDYKIHRMFANILSKIYPEAFFYKSYDNLFSNWDYSYSYIHLLKKFKCIYFDTRDQDANEFLWTKFRGLNRQADSRDSLVYFNHNTNETIYSISYNSVSNKKSINYLCDAEKTDSTISFFLTGNLKFKNGNTQSSEQAFKGKYSSKLTKDNPYGMTCALSEVQSGEKYKISVWKFKNGNYNSSLVVTTNNSSFYYKSITVPIENLGNWEKLEYELSINEQLNNMDIRIYCYNSDQILPAYFDNLLIEKIHYQN